MTLVMVVDRARDIPRDCDGCDWTCYASESRWALTRIDPGCPVHGPELAARK